MTHLCFALMMVLGCMLFASGVAWKLSPAFRETKFWKYICRIFAWPRKDPLQEYSVFAMILIGLFWFIAGLSHLIFFFHK